MLYLENSICLANVVRWQLKLSRTILMELCLGWVESRESYLLRYEVVLFTLVHICLGLGLRVVREKSGFVCPWYVVWYVVYFICLLYLFLVEFICFICLSLVCCLSTTLDKTVK